MAYSHANNERAWGGALDEGVALMNNTIAIVDYGAGNLHSICKALQKVCVDNGSDLRPEITADRHDIEAARAVILPGVGAAGPTMLRLREIGVVDMLRETAHQKPFLGVCLGMQLLYDWHEEGEVQCLGVLRGSVRSFDDSLKVPHMGWNRLYTKPHAMFEGVQADAYFYFVHSYYVQPEDDGVVTGVTEYGRTFAGALAQDRLWATQFHPEKSGEDGLKLLSNFVSMVEAV
ncbi:MAG: imidazole glycerol phosphate synthase subunit HisH [Chloroflexia bacterium]